MVFPSRGGEREGGVGGMCVFGVSTPLEWNLINMCVCVSEVDVQIEMQN